MRPCAGSSSTLAAPVWGQARAEALYDRVLDLERVPDVAALAGDHGAIARRPPQQPQGDRHVQQIPQDAIDERGLIGAGQVEDHSGHPAAERHAQQRGRQHHADPHPGLGRGEILADDDGVGGHDPALRQAEDRRDDVEGGESFEGQKEQERQGLQARAEQQRAQAADAVTDDPRGEPAHDAEAQHQRQHLRAVRGAVAEIAGSTRRCGPAASTSRRSSSDRR